MAGNGPPPKTNRQRREAPKRGDWVTLEPLAGPVLPALDELPVPDGLAEWPVNAARYWNAWRESPVTAKWSEDDIALAIDTIDHYARTSMFKKGDGGVPLPASEFRLRMESLGLTPKGRRDNRYLLPEEAPTQLAAVEPISGGAAREVPERVIPEAI